MALGCRPIFPGWAGTLAKTADISLAKTDDEAAKIRSTFLRQAPLQERIVLGIRMEIERPLIYA